MLKKNHFISFMLMCMMLLPQTVSAQRLQQKTGRAVVAVNRTGGRSVTSTAGQGNLISWRKLAEEPEGTTYNVYRRAAGSTEYTKMNSAPLKNTNYAPSSLTNNTEYAVTAISPDGVEGPMSAPFLYKVQAWPNVWFSFDFDNKLLKRDDYRTKYVWPMDLDGDGEFDAVVCDRLFAGATGGDDAEDQGDNTATTTHKIQAYRLTGELLWTVDMGPNVNICAGQNDMVLAYDINCDGRCEVIVRSSDGTRFWDKQNNTWGKYVGGKDSGDIDGDGIIDYRTQNRRNPPFYISVIDGETGAEIACNELKYSELSEGGNGDNYRRDNRSSYMNFGYGAMEGHYGIAYLDGVHPSLIMECEDRDTGGTHHGYILTFDFDWQNGTHSNWHHSHTWVRNPIRPWCSEFHQIRILDSDGDGCDEMWAGGYGVNPAQNRYTSTGLGHGDRFIISDIDPDRPGIEGYAIQQSALLGQCLYDARTGERIKEWYLPSLYDVGRGACMDVDAAHKGYEIYSFTDDFIYDCKGEKTSYTRSGSGITTMFEGVWWNGDLQREELSSPGGSGWGTNLMITQVLNKARLVEFSNESSWQAEGGTGTRPAFMGDITGDWREEIILAKQNADHSTGLVGYTTNMPTNYSIYCLQQDPHYRGDCTTRGYYQHPNTGFYLGGGMPLPPLPPVFTADLRWKGAGAYTNYEMTQTASYADGKSVMFDLSGDNSSAINLSSPLSASTLYLMNPSGHDYVFEGKGTSGKGQLIKSMQGTATFNCGLGHTGQTIISEGALVVNGAISGPVELRAKGSLSGNVVLQDTIIFEGALNYEGCRLKAVGSQGVITSKKGMVLPGDVYLEVDADGKDCGRLVVEGDLSLKGTNYITVNLSSQDAARYVLAQCSGNLTADVSKLKTRGLEGINFDLVVEGNQLLLVINTTREATEGVLWTGTESGVWNYKAQNFKTDAATAFVAGDAVLFTDEGLQKTITLDEMMTTKGVTFRSGKYTLKGEGGISGTGDVVVEKDADVTLNMKYSDYTGRTIINGGTLTVPNFYDGGQNSAIGAAASKEGNLQINGGKLVLSQDNMGTDRVISLTDTATITISKQNSALSLKGQVKGTGYLVKDGAGQLNFTYGGANNFAGLIVKKGIVAQGAWNATFGRVGSPMVLAGGEVHQLDVNSTSTIPSLNHVFTVVEGTNNRIYGSSRGRLEGSFKGKGNLTITSRYVRFDISSNFKDFEGTLTADGSQWRLMSNVTDMGKTRLVLAPGAWIAHFKGGSGSEVTATTKVGSLSGTAADATLAGSNWEVGALGENTSFSGLIKAARFTKIGTGKLTLKTAGHTSPMFISGGTLELQNTTATVMTSGAITVQKDGCLLGNGTAGAVTVQKGGVITGGLESINTGSLRVANTLTLQAGSTLLVRMGKNSGNSTITAKGSIKHTNDTILVRVPEGRVLEVGEELTIFSSGFTSATGTFIVKCEAEDGSTYGFDSSTLLEDGKLRVASAVTGIATVPDADALVDVYTLDGVKVREEVEFRHALDGLQRGVYIVGGRKVYKR